MLSPLYLCYHIYTSGTKLCIELMHWRNLLGRMIFIAFGGHSTLRWFGSLLHNCELDTALGLLLSSHSWQNNSPIICCSWKCRGPPRWVLFRWFVFGNCALLGTAKVGVWICIATSDAEGEWTATGQVLFYNYVFLFCHLSIFTRKRNHVGGKIRKNVVLIVIWVGREPSVICHCLFLVPSQLDLRMMVSIYSNVLGT